MSAAQVTEEHIYTTAKVGKAYVAGEDAKAAQLIADSEAKAVASALSNVTCTHHNDQKRAECPVCLVAELRAEGDRLRAEVRAVLKIVNEQTARAERAEAELEEARKDSKRYRYIAWKSDTNPIMIIKLNDNILLHGYDANEAIDGAMKEEAK